MEDFADMNSNFQAKQHQLPIFKYESRKLNSDADANAPLEQEDIPAPSPPLMPHQNQISPPPTFNLPTTPLVTATEEPPPIPSPKEKETEDKEQNNIILPPSNDQPLPLQLILKPTYKRKPLGDGVYNPTGRAFFWSSLCFVYFLHADFTCPGAKQKWQTRCIEPSTFLCFVASA